jgi:Na+/phosphate symporter
MKEKQFFINPFRIISPMLDAEVERVGEAHPLKATEMTCLEEGLLIMVDKLIEMASLMHKSLIEVNQEKIVKFAKLAQEVHEQEKGLTGDLACSPSTSGEILRALVLFPGRLERIGDMLESIVNVASIKQRDGIYFSEKAHEELAQLHKTFLDILSNFRTVLATRDREVLDYVMAQGAIFHQMTVDFALAHEDRLLQGLCFPKASSLYLDILDSAKVANRHIMDMSGALAQLADSLNA